MLLCPVRGCRLSLARDGQRLLCERQHSFDVARSGYVNLLQPQDKKSKEPGDNSGAVAARRRLHDRGVTEPLLNAVRECLCLSPDDVVLDVGCGEGFYLGSLWSEMPFSAHGVDLSIPAIDAAARRYRECEWIVANADRFIPYADRSFSVVVSITARMNPGEFRRVLREKGRLIVAVPSPLDLIELRGQGQDRAIRTAETFAGEFDLTDRGTVTTAVKLDSNGIRDILVSIYRPLQPEPPQAMQVTLSLDILQFSPKT